jgi:hypothetical protein
MEAGWFSPVKKAMDQKREEILEEISSCLEAAADSFDSGRTTGVWFELAVAGVHALVLLAHKLSDIGEQISFLRKDGGGL